MSSCICFVFLLNAICLPFSVLLDLATIDVVFLLWSGLLSAGDCVHDPGRILHRVRCLLCNRRPLVETEKSSVARTAGSASRAMDLSPVISSTLGWEHFICSRCIILVESLLSPNLVFVSYSSVSKVICVVLLGAVFYIWSFLSIVLRPSPLFKHFGGKEAIVINSERSWNCQVSKHKFAVRDTRYRVVFIVCARQF